MGAGHNANDLYEAMKDGTYSFDDFNKTVMRLNKQGFAQYASFAQQARDATQGIGTAFENVRNRVAKAVQKVIEAIGVENIAGLAKPRRPPSRSSRSGKATSPNSACTSPASARTWPHSAKACSTSSPTAAACRASSSA